MNVTIPLTKELQTKLAIFCMVMVAFSTGAYTANHEEKTLTEIQTHVQTVDEHMEDMLEGQITAEHAQFELRTQGDWAYRYNGSEKKAFEEYLEACNDVVISYDKSSTDLSSKIDTMNKLKSDF